MKYPKKISQDSPPGHVIPTFPGSKYAPTRTDCPTTKIFTPSLLYHWKICHHYTTFPSEETERRKSEDKEGKNKPFCHQIT